MMDDCRMSELMIGIKNIKTFTKPKRGPLSNFSTNNTAVVKHFPKGSVCMCFFVPEGCYKDKTTTLTTGVKQPCCKRQCVSFQQKLRPNVKVCCSICSTESRCLFKIFAQMQPPLGELLCNTLITVYSPYRASVVNKNDTTSAHKLPPTIHQV